MATLYKVHRGYQITIPKSIREKMDLHIGDPILIELTEDEIRLRPVHGVPKATSKTSRSFWKDVDEGPPCPVTEEDIIQEVQTYRTQRRNRM